jgi:Uma2 family endonuclease
MAIIEKTMTADQLFALGDIGPCELIRGELIHMTPTGYDHGWISGNIVWALRNFVKNIELGRVLSSEVGFLISRNPDTVLAPDAAFVRADRDPPGGLKKFFPGPPDLAVEVLSPLDRASEVLSKVSDWLEAGCRKVWVVDPETRSIAVYAPKSEMRVLHLSDVLTDEELLPGFQIAVRKVFPA